MIASIKIAVFLSTLLGAPTYEFYDTLYEFETIEQCRDTISAPPYKQRLATLGANYASETGVPNGITAMCVGP
jgi:hypothetical protein